MQVQSICKRRHVIQNTFCKKVWVFLLTLLIALHGSSQIANISLLQNVQAAPQPQTNELTFTQWSQRCLERLRAAHLQATSVDSSTKGGTAEIRQLLNEHDSDDYLKSFIGFWDKDQNPTFSIVIHLRDPNNEDDHVPSVWYPTYRTSIPVSEKRYFLGRNTLRLIPLDDPQGIPLVGYSYARRINNVVATIASKRQPSQLRPLIQIFEPAVDACLMDGQGLPPLLSPRMTALPLGPTAPSPVLRAAPPLTIEVRGMPVRGRLHLAMGEWEYDLVEPGHDKIANHKDGRNQHIIIPVDWFSNFRSQHVLHTGFSNSPIKVSEKQRSGMLLSGVEFRADGTEREICIIIEIKQDRTRSIRIIRRLPSPANVVLKPDWTPSTQGRPVYLLINHSGQAIRGAALVHNFEGIVEYWKDGRWQPYAGSPPDTKKNDNQSDGEVLESGNSIFSKTRTKEQILFKPGRYRYLVSYTAAQHENGSGIIDLFEVSSEFEIRGSK